MNLEPSMILASLLSHAQAQGADMLTLRALVEESSQLGAARALRTIGLHDGDATADITQLRELLQAWRDTKRSARNAAVGWLVRAVMAAILVGLTLRFGLAGITHP